MFGPEKYSIYLKLPYIGMAPKRFRIAVQRAIHNGYHNARPVIIFKARKMLPNSSKYVRPLLATSNVIYKFVYCCDNSYLGRTTQRLGSRIRQHVPKYAEDLFDSRVLRMLKHVVKCTHRKALASPSSAILKNLLENDNWAQRYTSDCYTVNGRTETTFKLCVKEAILIHRHKPTLNIPKEAYETLLFIQLGRGYKVNLPRSF